MKKWCLSLARITCSLCSGISIYYIGKQCNTLNNQFTQAASVPNHHITQHQTHTPSSKLFWSSSLWYIPDPLTKLHLSCVPPSFPSKSRSAMPVWNVSPFSRLLECWEKDVYWIQIIFFPYIFFFTPTFKQLIQLIFTNSLLSNAILGLRKWREKKTGWEIEKKTKKQKKIEKK